MSLSQVASPRKRGRHEANPKERHSGAFEDSRGHPEAFIGLGPS